MQAGRSRTTTHAATRSAFMPGESMILSNRPRLCEPCASARRSPGAIYSAVRNGFPDIPEPIRHSGRAAAGLLARMRAFMPDKHRIANVLTPLRLQRVVGGSDTAQPVAAHGPTRRRLSPESWLSSRDAAYSCHGAAGRGCTGHDAGPGRAPDRAARVD